MTQRRRLRSNALIVAIVATILLPAQLAWGAGNDDVDDLRREVRQLQAQMQALRLAVTEATELERQRSTNLARAMNERPSSPEPEAAKPVASSEAGSDRRAAAAAPAAATGDDEAPRSKRQRHHRSSRHRSKSGKSQGR